MTNAANKNERTMFGSGRVPATQVFGRVMNFDHDGRIGPDGKKTQVIETRSFILVNTSESTYTSVNLYGKVIDDKSVLCAGKGYDAAKMTHPIKDAAVLLKKLSKYVDITAEVLANSSTCPIAELVAGDVLAAAPKEVAAV